MQYPSVLFLTLWRAARIAFQRAPIGRPTERNNVVVKFAGFFAFGKRQNAGKCDEHQNGSEEPAHWVLSFFGPAEYTAPKFPDNGNRPDPRESPFRRRDSCDF
ncbi:hypothetical protein Pcinc_001036 [Petrolisthes cinctipes]|uniref:Uncharacterized protein n=1 Tax=Petrolisthes cinctipes TaxID=88211 RepID=A0AAE1L3R6_PETCI|nr:hypothetical protein Pcinc_001036 [Petrolisthes cinctipes]